MFAEPPSLTTRGYEPKNPTIADDAPVAAAVLVPFILGSVPSLLLTKRATHLNKHAGQIGFPAGRIDCDDSGLETAALREPHEEIAPDPSRVEIFGRLSDVTTGTVYRIIPVIELVPQSLLFQASPHEVHMVFEFPLSTFLNPNAPRRRKQHVGGLWREYWVWSHPDLFIWGATAAIRCHLALSLRLAEARGNPS